jgi:hypothetical protein
MLWQFGELGYDYPIDFNGRTGNKPIPWGDEDGLNYHKDPTRVKLYKATAAIIKLVDKYNTVFEEGTFTWTPSGQFRKINVSHSGMNVTIIGNFGVSEGNINPGFQHTGTWYDYFSGKDIYIASDANTITLAPGQFHIFVDKPVDFPEQGLTNSTLPVIINVPGSLTALLEGTTATKLNWVDTSTGETGFVLERKSEDQKTFVTLATLQENITEYTDLQIVDGKIYEYRVKATSATKPHSDWSNTATVSLPLLAPANLKAATSGLRSVKLNWEDRSGNEKVYVVERATQSGQNTTAFSKVAELPANTTSYTDTKFQLGLMHHYRVVAKDSDQTSDYSNQISIRPVDDVLSGLKDKLLSSIDLFPNPASDLLTIITNLQLTETIKFQIANMQGVVLTTFEIRPGMNLEVQLNVGTWREGLYVVQVSYQNLTVRKMLMVKR